jgi:hypothetical protein
MAVHTETLSIIKLAHDVADWLMDEADGDDIEEFVSDWRGVPRSTVSCDVGADEVIIKPTSEAERTRARGARFHAEELANAMADLFKHCAMIHKYGGEASNAQEAGVAVKTARELLHNLGIEV